MSVELEQRRDDIEPQAPSGDMKPVRTRERDRTSLNHKRDWILLFLLTHEEQRDTLWTYKDGSRQLEQTSGAEREIDISERSEERERVKERNWSQDEQSL